MSVTIKIKEKIIDGKFKIPELVNPRQKLIELDNDEDISWEYIGTDDPEITIKALETFNGKKGGPVQVKGNKKIKRMLKFQVLNLVSLALSLMMFLLTALMLR